MSTNLDELLLGGISGSGSLRKSNASSGGGDIGLRVLAVGAKSIEVSVGLSVFTTTVLSFSSLSTFGVNVSEKKCSKSESDLVFHSI